MSKHNITILNIKSWQDFKCFFGIHDYEKGVEYALGSRKDVCSNPKCQDFTATYGWKRTCRWVTDWEGNRVYNLFAQARLEKRRVLVEKVEKPKVLKISLTELQEDILRIFAEDAL